MKKSEILKYIRDRKNLNTPIICKFKYKDKKISRFVFGYICSNEFTGYKTGVIFSIGSDDPRKRDFSLFYAAIPEQITAISITKKPTRLRIMHKHYLTSTDLKEMGIK